MKNKRFITFSVAAALMAGCTTDPTDIGVGVADRIPLQLSGDIEQVAATRVDDSGFCNGDAVGIYVVNYVGGAPGAMLDSGNQADNVRFEYNEADARWTPECDVYYYDKTTHVDIIGYYPYMSAAVDVNAYPFEIAKDQSADAANGQLGGYEASDFLWGKAADITPTEQRVNIVYKHRMAGVLVELAEGAGFADGEWANVEKQILVTNTARKASIDLSTGEAIPAGEVPATGIVPYRNGGAFRAVVVPQTVAASAALFNITVDGTSYILRKSEPFEYVSGKLHKFTVEVSKKTGSGFEFKLIGESIMAWENDNVSHDATAREYIVINVEKAGTLEECIAAAGKEYAKVKNLKITGAINAQDFYFMRDEMDKLQALNLQEVKIKGGAAGHMNGGIGYEYTTEDDEIPAMALQNKESLYRIVLPDKLKKISTAAFDGCKYLTGSIIIPEGVTEIMAGAFNNCSSLYGSLYLPTTLKYIGTGYDRWWYGGAFKNWQFTCELKLPSNVEYIGNESFQGCKGFYGNLVLPDKLAFLGQFAFERCENLTGSLEIPRRLIDIQNNAFSWCGFNGTLQLHDNLETIGNYAFNGCHFRGELHLPKNLKILNDHLFDSCDFSGELKLPEDLAVIGEGVFAYNWRLCGTLTIPKNVQAIAKDAFRDCRGIEAIIFEDGIETLSANCFSNCFGIGSIVCKGTIPAYVMTGAFDGVPKDNFTVEVPESAVQQYQTAVGWSDFKRISAYRNLVIRPNVATAINTSVTRDLVLDAESEWIVEKQPDWVTLDKTSGDGKTELKLTFAEMPQGSETRTGEIVFKLKDKDYRTRCTVSQYNYEYAEDEIVALQKATRGNGVNLVFLGDGYNAKEVSEGAYLKDIKEAVEHYFGIEPYKTYRDYFNVYTGIAVSPESGIGSVNTIIYNRFNTSAKGGVTLGGRNGESDDKMILEYACKAPTVSESNIGETLVVMIPNTSDYGGICYMYDDGTAIAYCPKSDYGYPLDFRGVIQHEAGGHGFGKLGDEYIYHNAFIDACSCTCCGHVFEFNMAKAKGWYPNLSLTGKMNEVPWSHLIFHDKYKHIVDIFEGGFMHSRGVYRSEQNSCMNNDITYYSTVSREAIVKRIKQIAGETYTFDDFVANDVMDAATVNATRSAVPEFVSKAAMYQQAPVMMGKRPKLND